MAQPSNYPEWATAPSGGDVVEPIPSKKASGWRKVAGVPEKPPYQQFNWWMNNTYLWIKHLKEEAVSYDGLKTFNNGISTDTIVEKTLGSGVTMNSPTYGFGIIPVGGIIAIGNAQAWTLPAANEVKDGYALCNGNTFAALGAGNYNAALTGNRPNLSDSRFIMGGSAAGAAGNASGSGSVSFSSASISTTGGAASFNKTVMNTNQTGGGHSHTIAHVHQSMYITSTFIVGAPISAISSVLSFNTIDATYFVSGSVGINPTYGSGLKVATSNVNGSKALYTSGAINDAGNAASSSASAISWDSAAVSTTFTNPTFDANQLTTGTCSLSSIVPKYFTAVYIMRVK